MATSPGAWRDVHVFAGCAVQQVHEHVHGNVLFVVKSLNGPEERDVDEEKARPFLAGGIAGGKDVAQKSVVKDQTDHAEEDDGAKNLKKQPAEGFGLRFARDPHADHTACRRPGQTPMEGFAVSRRAY